MSIHETRPVYGVQSQWIPEKQTDCLWNTVTVAVKKNDSVWNKVSIHETQSKDMRQCLSEHK